jgi:hypothetical protein
VTLQTDVPYDSTTYRYDVPEVDDEHLFVIIARQNGDIWIQAVVGKHGSVLGADANAIAMMAAYAIRYGAPEDKIIHALKGVTHDKTNYLWAKNGDCCLSIADGIGRALEADNEM